MQIVLNLPNTLVIDLLQQANRLKVPPDRLAEDLFRDGLPRITTLTPDTFENEDKTDAKEQTASILTETVARIKALKPDPDAIHPAAKPLAELAADLKKNPPSSDLFRYEEFAPLWQQFEQELKDLDSPTDLN